MTDHHDEMRVSPDPSQAEDLRRRLHARMARASQDLHGASDIDLDPAGLVLDDHDAAVEDEVHRRPVRGGRPLALALAGVAVLALVAGAVGLLRIDRRDDQPITTDPPATTVPATLPGDPPIVWYDARGLHHGDVVEQTPVDLLGEGGDGGAVGALTLVRNGAVYLDPATLDVWFHPWGGEPRIVGHNSAAGPGGDPNGDTAAWFEGSELVVYDTAVGREISRSDQRGRIVFGLMSDHRPTGNGFLQVSPQHVVWNSFQAAGTYSYDLRTGSTSAVEPRMTSAVELPTGRFLEDVHDRVEVSGRVGSPDGSLVVSVPGRAELRLPALEGKARLSPSGNYLLGVEDSDERHGAVIVDIRTGEVWPVPRDVYPWIAWSYGDIALVDHTEDALLACDAARRACEQLHPEGPFLMPTN